MCINSTEKVHWLKWHNHIIERYFVLDFLENLFEKCMVEYFIFNIDIVITSMFVCIECMNDC